MITWILSKLHFESLQCFKILYISWCSIIIDTDFMKFQIDESLSDVNLQHILLISMKMNRSLCLEHNTLELNISIINAWLLSVNSHVVSLKLTIVFMHWCVLVTTWYVWCITPYYLYEIHIFKKYKIVKNHSVLMF